MRILDFKDFMKKYNLKNATMNESDLQRVHNYPIYPREIFSDEGIIKNDNGSLGGTHWTCFYIHEKNHFTLIVSVVNQTNFYLIKNLNQ